eukprot:TRINITY_DN102797_c0_g1_i1.p1 TRINITY_DN102797_c0_g1~~TRINITY_DN102797_c0_g1_i1.p1  ORF type:complete len:644 (-),score=130.04 TRINITY_DN102797_c0_g1_i1:427-2358(-)
MEWSGDVGKIRNSQPDVFSEGSTPSVPPRLPCEEGVTSDERNIDDYYSDSGYPMPAGNMPSARRQTFLQDLSDGMLGLLGSSSATTMSGGPPFNSEETHGDAFRPSAIAQGLKRLSTLAENASSVFASPSENLPEDLGEGWEPSSSSSSSSRAPAEIQKPRALNLDKLLNEAHLPFKRLLSENPDPDADGVLRAFPQLQRLQASTGFGRRPAEESQLTDPGESSTASTASWGGSSLFSAVVRARLANHLLGCYEAVRAEVSGDEAWLWETFIDLDSDLQGTLRLPSGDCLQRLGRALEQRFGSIEVAEAWIRELDASLDETGDCDFPDLLEVLRAQGAAGAGATDQLARLSKTFRTGVATLLEGTGFKAPNLRTSHQEIRSRCAQKTIAGLASSAAAYQRTLVLTMSWQCEQSLLTCLRPPVNALHPDDIAAVLKVLHAIHSMLVPTERVLWELMSEQSATFDGRVGKLEVLDTLEHLQSFEDVDDASKDEMNELEELRRLCQSRSVNSLLGNATSVHFSEVLRWWWDMPEEYREAAGLVVPAALLRQSVERSPEEMFRTQLRRVATDQAFRQHSLQGQVRTFAELRALAVKRSIETFSYCSTAGSRCSTSEHGQTSFATAVQSLSDALNSDEEPTDREATAN